MRTLPALKSAALLALGITIGFWTSPPPLPALYVAALALAVALLLNRHPVFGPAAASLQFIASGVATMAAAIPPTPAHPVSISFKGRVIEEPCRFTSALTVPLRVIAVHTPTGTKPFRALVQLKLSDPSAILEPGRLVTGSGLLVSFPPPRNPADADFAAWMTRNGYLGVLHTSQPPQILNEPPPLPYRLHDRIRQSIERLLPGYAGLFKALILGARQDVNPDLINDLRTTGLMHLLALSGLHVGFLVALTVGACTILRVPSPTREVISLAAVVLFLMLVPPRPATLRAVVMAWAFLGGVLLRRWSHPLNTLGYAALLTLAFRPANLFDPGFQMSYAAAAAIIGFAGPVAVHCRKLTDHLPYRLATGIKTCWGTLLVSAGVAAAVLPITSYWFGRTQLATPLFNVPAIPLLTLIYAGGWMTVLADVFWRPAAALMADGVNLLATLWVGMVDVLSHLAPPLSYRATPLAVVLLLGIVTWTAKGMRKRRLPRLTLALAAAATVLVWDASIPRWSGFRAWFLDVGHGDAQVWLFPDGSAAAVDAGPPVKHGVHPIVAFLNRLGKNDLRFIAASHLESDHIGGFVNLLDQIRVRAAFRPPMTPNTGLAAHLMAKSDSLGLKWQEHTAGLVLSLPGSVTLKVVNPPSEAAGWSPNDASLALRLEVPAGRGQRARLLTTGDVEAKGEAALALRTDIQAELIKIPHHGSPTSSSSEFLQAVSPTVAVISRSGWSEWSPYLPVDTTLSRLRSRNVAVYQTALIGAVGFRPVADAAGVRWERLDWRSPGFFQWLLDRW